MTHMAALARWSADHHGVLTTDQLRRLGFTPAQIATLCRNGTLDHRCRGVYAHAAVAPSPLRSAAVSCAATGGGASFTTAGRIWDFRRVPADPLVHMSVHAPRSARCATIPGAFVCTGARSSPPRAWCAAVTASS